MIALKGQTDIGDQINKKVVAPLAAANQQLSQSDFPDFNSAEKLGDGKEKVDRLTNLVAIFESRALDFSKNRADGCARAIQNSWKATRSRGEVGTQHFCRGRGGRDVMTTFSASRTFLIESLTCLN